MSKISKELLIDRKVKVFKALANPTRLQIIDSLKDGERCVCEIIPAIGKAQSTTSKHLDMLYDAGILDRRMDGRRTLYRIRNPKVLDIIKAIELMVLEDVIALVKALESLKDTKNQ
ncbi:MAG: metalloregulator ArsR/SmtB family transcription factor [Candidatus Nezhaarchaeales archaeon]|nr:MAG: ArsR family transcriptional regulator [Candidatus Nezhaarchaeota archaeon WYZ-LMO8]TDA35804.1 MAG: ArsR family transcriptional regulator [Candidatus Nezhaarchaeota archaeon WYZ-LMO7]